MNRIDRCQHGVRLPHECPECIHALDAPDQARLKIARMKIEAILKDHDLAGVVVLHTPGMCEFFYDIRPSYSVVHLDTGAGELQVRSKLDRDHGGDAARQQHDQVASANMTAALADSLWLAARMFAEIDGVVSKTLQAEHTTAVFVPDSAERERH